MNKNFKFSKAFGGCAIFSLVVIIAGVACLFVKGINFSTDYAPGLVEEVRIAPTAVEVTYTGSATVTVESDNTGFSLVVSGVGAENVTKDFPFGLYPTVNEMASAFETVEGVKAEVVNGGSESSYGIFTNSMTTSRLSDSAVYRLYVADSANPVTTDAVREALSEVEYSKLQGKGTGSDLSFQITVKASDEEYSSQALLEKITGSLKNKFGENNVAVVQTTYNAPASSASTVLASIVLASATILLIWLYATIRFHWDFALGAIVALLHDCLVMFAFISWFQIEFSTTTLAAVLTIFGYSINATVVILDRIRANMKTVQTKDFKDILNKSLNETISRSVITTVTTLFASLSLWIFTSGAIQTFAIVLTIGLISGCYSSMFISQGFIAFVRRNWEGGENANHVRPHAEKKVSLEK